jgi:hypothetical protein
MSLPAAWVDKIFEKLAVVYGRDFLGRWEGLDLNDVKSDWAHELSGLFRHPSAIAHALANLPDRAPTVVEFRKIARSAPDEKPLEIEHSPAGKERIAAELAKLAPVMKADAPQGKDYRAWARAIVDRHAAGDRITRTQLTMAREALRMAA